MPSMVRPQRDVGPLIIALLAPRLAAPSSSPVTAPSLAAQPALRATPVLVGAVAVGLNSLLAAEYNIACCLGMAGLMHHLVAPYQIMLESPACLVRTHLVLGT